MHTANVPFSHNACNLLLHCNSSHLLYHRITLHPCLPICLPLCLCQYECLLSGKGLHARFSEGWDKLLRLTCQTHGRGWGQCWRRRAAAKQRCGVAVWRPAREGRAPASNTAGDVCRVRCMLGSNGPKTGAWVGCSAVEAGRGSGGHGHAHALAQAGGGQRGGSTREGGFEKTTCESRLGRGAQLPHSSRRLGVQQQLGDLQAGRQEAAVRGRGQQAANNQRGARIGTRVPTLPPIPPCHPSLQISHPFHPLPSAPTHLHRVHPPRPS